MRNGTDKNRGGHQPYTRASTDDTGVRLGTHRVPNCANAIGFALGCGKAYRAQRRGGRGSPVFHLCCPPRRATCPSPTRFRGEDRAVGRASAWGGHSETTARVGLHASDGLAADGERTLRGGFSRGIRCRTATLPAWTRNGCCSPLRAHGSSESPLCGRHVGNPVGPGVQARPRCGGEEEGGSCRGSLLRVGLL